MKVNKKLLHFIIGSSVGLVFSCWLSFFPVFFYFCFLLIKEKDRLASFIGIVAFYGFSGSMLFFTDEPITFLFGAIYLVWLILVVIPYAFLFWISKAYIRVLFFIIWIILLSSNLYHLNFFSVNNPMLGLLEIVSWCRDDVIDDNVFVVSGDYLYEKQRKESFSSLKSLIDNTPQKYIILPEGLFDNGYSMTVIDDLENRNIFLEKEILFHQFFGHINFNSSVFVLSDKKIKVYEANTFLPYAMYDFNTYRISRAQDLFTFNNKPTLSLVCFEMFTFQLVHSSIRAEQISIHANFTECNNIIPYAKKLQKIYSRVFGINIFLSYNNKSKIK